MDGWMHPKTHRQTDKQRTNGELNKGCRVGIALGAADLVLVPSQEGNIDTQKMQAGRHC